MTRSAIRLTFPLWRKTAGNPPMRSLWVDDALDRESGRRIETLASTAKTDICIVGGGFTGLWTACRILERDPGVSLCLVEADECGTGASGRNSGAAGDWWTRLPALARMFGDTDALRVLRASEAGVSDIHAFVAENHVDCSLRHVRSVWSMNVPGRPGAWEGVFKVADRLGIEPPFRRLSDDELRMFFDAGPYYAGVIDDKATRIQPAMLARGLRNRAIELGCRIYERSPVSCIEGRSTHVAVDAGKGRVEAGQVVLAANAWMAHFAEFRPRVHVTSSDIVATDPIPGLLSELGIDGRPGGTNSRQMLNYYGQTPDGRIYVGRGGGALGYRGRVTPDFHWSAARTREVEADFHFLYPELARVPASRSWGGPIDRSTTGLPFFGRMRGDERISYGIGYTGHGVGAAAIGGRILASMALGENCEWTDLGRLLSSADNGCFPPEPARYLVGALVRDAVGRKERRELTGRRPSSLDKALAKLANATLPHRHAHSPDERAGRVTRRKLP